MEGKNNEVKGQNIEQFEIRLMSARGGGVMNSPIAPIGIARRMILAIVTSREIYPGNFKWFHRAKLFRGFKW